MNNEIQRFDFKGAALRTLTDEAGEPWFVAKDVCDILEISNSRDAVSKLDSDEKGVANTDTLGGAQQASIISEPGLYKLIMRSRKPEAKEFQRWVTHEVLPQIRRTGGYIPTSDADDDMTILAKAVVTHSDGHVTISRTAKVTGKGQAYFIRRYCPQPTLEAGA